jgi:hypothetical protein
MKGKPNKKDFKKTPTPSLPVSQEKREIDEVVSQAFVSFLKNQAKERTTARKNLDSLTATVLEFLNSFILIGYDAEGTPVKIISAHNQQEADSLATLLNKFFISTSPRHDHDDHQEDAGD